MTVDLRSDTVTRPSAAMRSAMAEAEVGDDVYGEDPTVNALESRVAAMLGHDAGLFTPTGSLANLLGVRTLVEPGDEILADSLAHILRAELGGHAVLGGVTTRTWVSPDGTFRAADPLRMMVPDGGDYQVSTAAVAVENTHNFSGGRIADLAELERLRAGTSAAGVFVHLDGARLANAHVATGIGMDTYGRLADSVSLCLSKGLGAPVGSVLVGSHPRIAHARVLRKRYGAGMRQAGILAAAGLWALDNNVARLADDHKRAAELASALAAVRPEIVDPAAVQTNIIVLDLSTLEIDAATFAGQAAERGVLLSVLSPVTARLVTHLDVDDAGAERAAEVLSGLLRK
ncbi:GntG family PLP-dependent aldolase [Saxibacter everestensis]|uniref:GntG family PLP-dependent aldolase n=1 Tax=Saxibacter everestensis TaxID=2909229 RepID=A0ABY8QWC0_9MICO|nr:GntG family PLP-dependent aldolase [Brevibacteriaceae bacterium ZFBP1038]